MTVRSLRAFGGGLVPRTDKRLLRDDQAQIAQNAIITSGALMPLRDYLDLYTSAKSGSLLSAHRLTAANGSDVWLAWTADVDAVRAPLANNSSQRVYYTGDGEPRVTDLANATSGSDNRYPDACYALGIPRPTTAPTLGTISGGTGVTETRSYVFTFVAKTTLADGTLLEEEGATSVAVSGSGKNDDTWTVNLAQTSLNNSNTITTKSHSSGVTTVSGTSTVNLRVGEYVVASSVRYPITEIVNSTQFKVTDAANAFPGSGTWTRDAPFPTSGMVKRIYRTTGSDWFKVADVSLATTSFADNILDSALPGPVLDAADNNQPPTDLKALIALPNGCLAGISGNKLCLSKPYQPHAWPDAYQYPATYAGVSLGHLGTTVVMTTEGSHWIATGTDPSAITFEGASTEYPCVAKRGTVSLPFGVAWPTHEGIVIQAPGGAEVITKMLYTREEWAPLDPSTIFAAAYDGRYVASYRRTGSTVQEIIILDPSDGSALFASTIQCTGLYADRRSGKMYVLHDAKIAEWNAGIRLQMDWQSKEFVEATPQNWGAAKLDIDFTQTPAEVAALQGVYNVVADANEVISATTAGWKGGEVAAHALCALALCESPLAGLPPSSYEECGFYLYVDGAPFAYRRVTDSKAFRLPSTDKYDNWSARVITNVKVSGIMVGTTVKALRQG